MQINNALLVYEEGCRVEQRFCPEKEAQDFIASAHKEMREASVFVVEDTDIEWILSVSPNLRGRVEDTKSRMRSRIRLQGLLTTHGIPMDRNLRKSILRAFEDWTSVI